MMGLPQSGQFFVAMYGVLSSAFVLRQLSQNEWPHPILSQCLVLGLIIFTVKDITHTVGLIIVLWHEPHATLCIPHYESVGPITLRITYLFDESP